MIKILAGFYHSKMIFDSKMAICIYQSNSKVIDSLALHGLIKAPVATGFNFHREEVNNLFGSGYKSALQWNTWNVCHKGYYNYIWKLLLVKG